jgi:hypothetical protein
VFRRIFRPENSAPNGNLEVQLYRTYFVKRNKVMSSKMENNKRIQHIVISANMRCRNRRVPVRYIPAYTGPFRALSKRDEVT